MQRVVALSFLSPVIGLDTTEVFINFGRWVASGTCNGFAANIISEFPVAVTTAATAYLPLMESIFVDSFGFQCNPC